jgi:membrane-associated phospholipid phosphatase
MQSIKSIICNKENRFFYVGMLLFLIASIIFLIVCGKSVAFLSLNAYHPFWLNVFFINYTFIGDGIFALCLIGVMYFYFKKKNLSIALIYSFLISGLTVQVIKNSINAPRPKLFFESGQYLFFLDGITRTGNSSFPSGHTATAFAIATVLVIMMKNKKWQLPILFAAILVGYSRIYLAQHFLLDVVIGAFIGSLSGIMAVYLLQNDKQLKKGFKRMHRLPKNNLPTSSPSPVQPA